MPRRLPWKNQTAVLSGRKGKRLVTPKDELPSRSRSESPDARADHTRSHSDTESSHEEDMNWRITESEFCDTARHFTRALHQTEYDRLCQVQRKELENSETLYELLGQPVVQQVVPALPVRVLSTAGARLVPLRDMCGRGFDHSADVTTASLARKTSTNATFFTPVSKPIGTVTQDITELNDRHLNAVDDESEAKPTSGIEGRPGNVKLSDAAIARKRKREHAQKAEISAIPLF